MAVNPILIKAALQVTASAMTNEKSRQVLIMVIFLPFLMILLILASPFAIFFAVSGDGENETSISDFMANLHSDFIKEIESEQRAGMDQVHMIIMGSEDGQIIDNRGDVLIIYGVKNHLLGEATQQLSVLSEGQLEDLKNLYHEMNRIEVSVDEIPIKVRSTEATPTEEPQNPPSDADENHLVIEADILNLDQNQEVDNQEVDNQEVDNQEEINQQEELEVRKIKTIRVNSMTAEEMADIYGFNQLQKSLVSEMKTSGLIELVYMDAPAQGTSLGDIEAIKKVMVGVASFDGQALVGLAESLLGKVSYFWGGKSLTMGWDPRWGRPMEVTSLGSPSTGAIKPYGLDCSGFITWVFLNAGLPLESIDKTLGQGTSSQWNKSISILESQARPGDLVFLAIPGTRKTNHVAMVSGRDDSGKIKVIHCTSSDNKVVESLASDVGLTYFRRPLVLLD